MSRSSSRMALGAWLLLVVGAASAQQADYFVDVAEGIQPRMSAAEAAQKAVTLVATRAITDVPAQDERGQQTATPAIPEVLEVHCIHGRDFGALVPYSEGQQLPWDPVWVIRVKGPMGKRTPDGKGRIVADTGYVVIDDATGEVVGRGAPWPDDPRPPTPKVSE